MAKKKSSSRLARFNVFANSPRFVRLFGIVIIVLMLGGAGYGAYRLTNQNSGEAASSKLTWYYNSNGIKHDYGFVQSGEHYGSSGKLWAALSGDQDGKSNAYAWRGPGVKLSKGQYMGCFFYRLVDVRHTSSGKLLFIERGKAELQVYNNTTGKVNHGHTDTGVTADPATLKEWKLRRTCLAFYIGRENGANVSLRLKLNAGNLYIKKTKISKITSADNRLSNINLLIPKDNITWTIGGRYN